LNFGFEWLEKSLRFYTHHLPKNSPGKLGSIPAPRVADIKKAFPIKSGTLSIESCERSLLKTIAITDLSLLRVLNAGWN